MIRPAFDLIRGIIIGAGAILPGISGASLAVVFGVYEEFMELIAHPLKNLKQFFSRRLFLCIGIAIGFLAFTLVLDCLFSSHSTPLVFLFSGFIAGTLPEIFTVARKHGMGKGEVIAFCVTAGLLITMALTRGMTSTLGVPDSAASIPTAIDINLFTWVFAGAIIALGSLLPGLSASFILIFLGLYGPLLDSVKHIDLPVALSLGAGALVSLVIFSQMIESLYRRFHGIMSFAVLGFTLGSLFLVFPGVPEGTDLLLCASLSLAGFASSFFLARYGNRTKPAKKSL
jgi:putative membrane protein